MTIPPNPFAASHLGTDRDYHPAWDVPDMNESTSRWLVETVRSLRGLQEPSPATKIAAINGSPGYGKTHLFGRVAHMVQQDVFFAFVPGFEPKTEPIEHIRWYVVESLFRRAADGFSPLERAMAEFCRPAFVDYFRALSPTIATRHDALLQRLERDSVAVFDIRRAVDGRDAYFKLADSFTSVLTDVDSGVARALALGWAPSPWGVTARRWLQGEDLPESDLAAVGLPEDAPSPLKVLKAIPVLFQHGRPLLICCDQIEGLLQTGDAETINRMSASLMDLLHHVPGQVVLSCFPDQWDKFLQNAFPAFKTRVRPSAFSLDVMTPEQALRLVGGRLSAWTDRPSGTSETWPFNEASVARLVRRGKPTPRRLIQICEEKFTAWANQEEYHREIFLDEAGGTVDPEIEFLKLWKKEMEAIRGDPQRTAVYLPEDRTYRGIFEVLGLAQSARLVREFGGVRIAEVHDDAIETNAQNRRPGARVVLTTGTGTVAQSVIVAFTKLENNRKWIHYWRALADASADPVVGAVLFYPKRDLKLGQGTQAAMDAAKRSGKLRFIALEDHPQAYQAIECLNALIDKANQRVLSLGELSLSAEDCRQMVLKTGVIDNLELFQILGQWRRSARSASSPVGDDPTATANGSAAPTAPKAPTTSSEREPQAETKPQPKANSTIKVETAPNMKVDPPSAGATQVTPPSPVVPPPAEAKAQTAPTKPAVDHSPWAAAKLEQAVKKLKLLGQDVEPDGFEIGPTFVRLRVVPLGKTNFQVVRNKAVDLRISLGLKVVPIVGSQAGCISIDVQRPDRATVALAEALAGEAAELGGKPAFPVGQDVAGETHWLDLSEPADCHLLVAGTTGSGKSEFLRAAVAALASRLGPDRVQFLLIDPKRVTFNLPRPSPYLRAPVAHGVDEALPLIKQVMDEMDRRYAILEAQGKSNVGELAAAMVPRIVVVIDEFASFLEDKESKKLVTALLKRIGAMARAAGIHLILATQRPDKDVITPVLRENLPGRIALHVTNKAGSELILGAPEAEHLLGKGDLFWKKGGELLRLQSPFATQAELEAALRMGPG